MQFIFILIFPLTNEKGFFSVPTGDISPIIIIIKTEYHRPSILSEREPEFGVILRTNNINTIVDTSFKPICQTNTGSFPIGSMCYAGENQSSAFGHRELNPDPKP
jgi:hypothetical protein